MGAKQSKKSFDVPKMKNERGASSGMNGATNGAFDPTSVSQESSGGVTAKSQIHDGVFENGNSGKATLRYIDSDTTHEQSPVDTAIASGQKSQSPVMAVKHTGAGDTTTHNHVHFADNSTPDCGPSPRSVVNGNSVKTEVEKTVSVEKGKGPAPAVPLAKAESIDIPPTTPTKEQAPKMPSSDSVPLESVRENNIPSPTAVEPQPPTPGSGDTTVTIEKIEELSASKRGSILTGDRLTVEVPEYAVSEPDSEMGSLLAETVSQTDLQQDGGMEFAEMTGAELAAESKKSKDADRVPSPIGVVEDASMNVPSDVDPPIVPITDVGYSLKDPNQEMEPGGLMQEIEWTLGGELVFIRGSFTDWKKEPMESVEKGTFAYTFPVTRGLVYYYNFVVDDVPRTDPAKDQDKYYVGDAEEDVNSIFINPE